MSEFSVKTDPACRLAALVRNAGYRARWCPSWTDEFGGAPAQVSIWKARLDHEATVIVRFALDPLGVMVVRWNEQETRTTEPYDLWAEIRGSMSDA